jgi:hypothetical protein
MKALFAATLLAGVLLVSSGTEAGSARPTHFWVEVADLGDPRPTQTFPWLVDFTVPTGLLGWECKLSKVQFRHSFDIPAGSAPPAGTTGFEQRADLVCSSLAGKVTGTIVCALQSGNDEHYDELKITDTTGHLVFVKAACKN